MSRPVTAATEGPSLGVHRWSFPACSVAESAAIGRALGLSFLDLGNSADHDPRVVAGDPVAAADALLAVTELHGLPFRDAFLHFAPKFSTNHPDPSVRADNLGVAGRYLEFAARLGLEGVTFSPGVAWPGDDGWEGDDVAVAAEGGTEARGQARYEDAGGPVDRSVRVMSELVRMGEVHGVEIRIEPHLASVTPTPEATLAYLERVPGLSLTLDYAHFVAQGVAEAALEPLRPHAGHWHLRQAMPGRGQVRFDEGAIDVRRLVEWWRGSGYRRGVCLEYVHSPWMDLDRVDCLTETVRLRDEVRRLLQEIPLERGTTRGVDAGRTGSDSAASQRSVGES